MDDDKVRRLIRTVMEAGEMEAKARIVAKLMDEENVAVPVLQRVLGRVARQRVYQLRDEGRRLLAGEVRR